MGRAFVYVILGGVVAGYAALEFVKRGLSHGEHWNRLPVLLTLIFQSRGVTTREPWIVCRLTSVEDLKKSWSFMILYSPLCIPLFLSREFLQSPNVSIFVSVSLSISLRGHFRFLPLIIFLGLAPGGTNRLGIISIGCFY